MKIKQDFFVKTTVIIVAMLFLIMGAKVVRYTIMKEILVDLSIGHGMLGLINNGTSIIYDENMSEEELGAGEKATIIFKNINFFSLSTYEEFEVYITILWNIILLIIMFSLRKKLNIIQAIFLILTILVAIFYTNVCCNYK